MTTAERRRELVEEIVNERSRAVVLVATDEVEPRAGSAVWPIGILRLVTATATVHDAAKTRELVRSIAVVALAWFEAIDDAE